MLVCLFVTLHCLTTSRGPRSLKFSTVIGFAMKPKGKIQKPRYSIRGPSWGPHIIDIKNLEIAF